MQNIIYIYIYIHTSSQHQGSLVEVTEMAFITFCNETPYIDHEYLLKSPFSRKISYIDYITILQILNLLTLVLLSIAFHIKSLDSIYWSRFVVLHILFVTFLNYVLLLLCNCSENLLRLFQKT